MHKDKTLRFYYLIHSLSIFFFAHIMALFLPFPNDLVLMLELVSCKNLKNMFHMFNVRSQLFSH